MTLPANIPVKRFDLARPNLFGSLQREIDRVFDDFMPNFTAGRGASEVKCRMDLADTKDGLELTVEVPGLDEKDVSVTVNDGLLTVSGEKKFEAERKDKNYYFSERGYGAFARSIDLPPGAKADQIKASLAKGVLKVTIPTPGKTEPKKIAVQTAS